jgi:hypothetical protein
MRERTTGLRGAGQNGSAGTLAAELVLFTVALVGVLVVFFYLPIGVVAAVAQDGVSEKMRAGFGTSGPVPLRLFRGVQSLTSLWPLAVGAGVLHVALRWLVRRRSTFGDSLAWDGLTSPLLTTAVAAGLGAAWVLATAKGHALDSVVWPGLGIAASGFVALGIAGLILALVRRHRGMRLALAGVVLIAVVGRLGAEAWGRAALRSHRERGAVELAAQDARRAARLRPVLRGAAIDEDAWPRYQKLIDVMKAHLSDYAQNRSLSSFADAHPFAAISTEAKTVLEARRADLVALHEATRCKRSSPPISSNPLEPIPSLLPIRQLASLGILEGHERAQAGDLAGAADRYLDVVRFGGDGGGGALIHALIGTTAEQNGLIALGRLVRSGRLEPAQLDRIGRERSLLERERISFADALAVERRMLDGLGDAIETWSSSVGEPLVLPSAVPYRALAAHAVRVADPLRREFENALASDDFDAWKQIGAKSDAVAGSSWNPLLRLVMGYSGSFDGAGNHSIRLFLTARENLAWFRLVQAAVTLQREKLARGRYPSDATALDLPKDPFAPSLPLKYRPDGSSYRLWSIGMDGIDEGGKAEKRADLVL